MATSPGDPSVAYGLRPVTPTEAREALQRVLGPQRAEAAWAGAISRAGLAGHETDLRSVTRLVDALGVDSDPVVVLCSRSLRIRLSSYEHLAATQTLVAGA